MTTEPVADDLLLPFQLENTPVRGRLVRLGAALDQILQQHAYPGSVARLLGETASLATALALALKFEGVFTLQTKSDGPVRLLVADVTHEGAIRATANFDAEALDAAPETDAGALLGHGHLAFTVDPVDAKDRYQGIVNLEGTSLVEAVQHYFRQSEQIPTGLVVAAARDEDGHWRGGCLMLQRMPGDEAGHKVADDTAVEDDWLRVMTLLQTCSAEELVDPRLPAEDLLYRLFHEEGVRVFDKKKLFHKCRCSEERVRAMLRSLPKDEVEALAVEGVVKINCSFCNRSYSFDEVARAGLWDEEKAEEKEV